MLELRDRQDLLNAEAALTRKLKSGPLSPMTIQAITEERNTIRKALREQNIPAEWLTEQEAH